MASDAPSADLLEAVGELGGAYDVLSFLNRIVDGEDRETEDTHPEEPQFRTQLEIHENQVSRNGVPEDEDSEDWDPGSDDDGTSEIDSEYDMPELEEYHPQDRSHNNRSFSRRQTDEDYALARAHDSYEALLYELSEADPAAPLQPRWHSQGARLCLERELMARNRARRNWREEHGDEGTESDDDDAVVLVDTVIQDLAMGVQLDQVVRLATGSPSGDSAHARTTQLDPRRRRALHGSMVREDVESQSSELGERRSRDPGPEARMEASNPGSEVRANSLAHCLAFMSFQWRILGNDELPAHWRPQAHRPVPVESTPWDEDMFEEGTVEVTRWDGESGGWQATIPDGYRREVVDFDTNPQVAGWGAIETLIASQAAKFEVAPFQDKRR